MTLLRPPSSKFWTLDPNLRSILLYFEKFSQFQPWLNFERFFECSDLVNNILGCWIQILGRSFKFFNISAIFSHFWPFFGLKERLIFFWKRAVHQFLGRSELAKIIKGYLFEYEFQPFSAILYAKMRLFCENIVYLLKF